MAIPEQLVFISLYEIDENIIPKIRAVNEHSESFKILQNSIKEDSQRHPITLRLLTDSEKQSAKPNAIYGIIDGHHRYRIATKNGQTIIPAIVKRNTNGNNEPNAIDDLKLALRLNESSIKMSLLEKGKIIYETAKKTGQNPLHLAEELFSIKTSMAYRCLNAYKKSIGEKIISKTRKSAEFKISSLRSAWKNLIKFKDIPTDVIESADCFQAIQQLEKILRGYKYLLSKTDGVLAELEKRK